MTKMDKMAASYKIPTSLKRKAKKDPKLPKFEWKTFRKRKEVGLGKYKGNEFWREIVALVCVLLIESGPCFTNIVQVGVLLI
jgi:hypothetical protein